MATRKKLTEPARLVNLTLEASAGGPIIAAVIAAHLIKAGATVSYGKKRHQPPDVNPRSLEGLHVHFGRTIWVTEEETKRWRKKK